MIVIRPAKAIDREGCWVFYRIYPYYSELERRVSRNIFNMPSSLLGITSLSGMATLFAPSFNMQLMIFARHTIKSGAAASISEAVGGQKGKEIMKSFENLQ